MKPGKSYLRGMTSKSFLEDGEWIGYYYSSLLFGHGQFDPPVIGIRFTALTAEPEDEEATERNHEELFDQDLLEVGNVAPTMSSDEVQILDVAAAGADNMGKFTLYGKIRSNGRIDMKKT